MSLVWIIYLGDIVRPISFISAVFGIISFFGVVIMGSIKIVMRCEDEWGDNDPSRMVNKLGCILAYIFVITLSISIFTPSQDAIYLMAGTQQFEQLAKTPEGDKVKQALDLGLDKVINSLKESK